MWGWQRDDMHVMVCDQLFRFIRGVLKAVAAEAGLVNDQVGDVLDMVDCGWGVVNSLVTFASRCMEPKLDLIDSVRESEDGEVGTLDRRDYLVALRSALTLIVGGNGNEVAQLLGRAEVIQSYTLVHLVVELNLIKSLLEVPSIQLIVDESFFGQEM